MGSISQVLEFYVASTVPNFETKPISVLHRPTATLKDKFETATRSKGEISNPTQILPSTLENLKKLKVETPKTLMGPHFSKGLDPPQMMKPSQSEQDISFDLQSAVKNVSSGENLRINFEKQFFGGQLKQEKSIRQGKNRISKWETEVKYLKSVLSRDYDSEKLAFIGDVLTKYFIKTPKLSSAGRTSSFYTDYMAKTSTHGGVLSNLMSSPSRIDSVDGNNL